ncbi:ATPase, partial [Thraustotheca clavata]
MLRITRGQWRAFCAAATTIPLASIALASAQSPRDDLSQPLGTNELASFLKLELQEARKDLKNAAKVAIGSVQGSHKLSFPTPRDSLVHEKILHEFISRLEPNSPVYAGRYLEAIASKSTPSVQYVFMDGSGSAQFLNDQFTLFLDKPVKGDIAAFVAAYRASHVGEQGVVISRSKAIDELAKLGLDIYDGSNLESVLTWDSLAGYASVKAEIQDTIVLALQNPELYEAIAKKTRCRYESNRPRAVLFEGPPGTGKTLSARIIAAQAGVPLVHIPVESVVSKWYGESEKKMAAIFEACEKLDGAIIFIDE